MSKTPLVKTTRRPSARVARVYAVISARVFIRVVFRERDRAREGPLVFRPVNANVLRAGLHAERVQQPVVVERITIELVDCHVEFVSAFDEIEALDGEAGGRIAMDLLRPQ